MKFLNDEDFIRGEVPMTKRDVRVLSVEALEPESGLKFLDIGAGTGSISVEMARFGCVVYAVERNLEAVSLIKENASKHGVSVKLIEGTAPEHLDDMELDRVFVGGSASRLESIIEYASKNLKSGGIIVMNFIVLKNAVSAMDYLKSDFTDVSAKLVSVSNVDKIGMLRAENPIFIIKGVKK